jgi:primosomal protein N' (replication factor Y)
MTESNTQTVIEVAIPVPLHKTFHYLTSGIPAKLVQPGMRVLVPFGRRTLTGYVLGPVVASGEGLKEIIEVLDREPLFTAREMEFLRWTAAYYLHPLGEVFKSALPTGINIVGRRQMVADEDGTVVMKEVLCGGRHVKNETFYCAVSGVLPTAALRGKAQEILEFLAACGETPVPATLLRLRFGHCLPQLRRLALLGLVAACEREVYRDPFRAEVFEHDTPLHLNPSQAEALARLTAAIDGNGFAPFLLHGVTGSGKTEVYLQAIAHALENERNALVLVPEIALTPQLVSRFKQRFSCGVAVLHSALSDGERYDEWRRIRRGEARIVIGARSAIFAPLHRIGVIVVDEEHESSYKQSEGLRYNARDLALVRGKIERAVVIMGSATPLVTTFHAAAQGKLGYLELPVRVRDLPMPTVEVADTRCHKGESFASQMKTALADNLAAGGQSILFLNRRGFATFVICEECGHVLRCPNCSVTLTYHRGKERHFCHYCDYSIPAPSLCPECLNPDMALLGRGTEKLEDEVGELFPTARVSRMDRDTTRGRGGYARALDGVRDGTVDILIGTQMIAKGHDFPGVTFVGVVSADASLNIPDFRSAERTFQMLTQVMGRAGRGDQPGRVIVQTLSPDHYAISHAVQHDYSGFYAEELAYRQELAYPPFAYLSALLFSGMAASEVAQGAETAARLLRNIRQEQKSRVEILGPAAAPLGKVRGRYRWQLLLKAKGRNDLHRLLAAFRARLKLPAVVRMNIDVDPVDML